MAHNNDRTSARRAQILTAAAAVFARHGYHGARMDDIVKESGLSKGALYWYFKGKEELATALVHHMLTAETQTLDRLLAQDAPAAERLEQLVRGFARELDDNPHRAPLAQELLALAQTIPDIRSCYSAHHDRYHEQLRTLLLQMNSTQSPAGGAPDHRIDDAALALLCVVDGMVLRWTLSTPTSRFDLEDRLWAAVSGIVRGMDAPA
ncbi:TetR/AcrR family transcriptional regulator [Streptomyces microflavus]|uniref:TetR/AcrR family transcriptional regulator n=1 Tax=Streptomyces microflavus TaxID=1919 RepID=UPI003808D34F